MWIRCKLSKTITVRAVASKLNISTHTVRRMIRDGVLPCMRVGSVLRLSRSLFEEYLEENRLTK
jgi:excisionase family DNA binding protein